MVLSPNDPLSPLTPSCLSFRAKPLKGWQTLPMSAGCICFPFAGLPCNDWDCCAQGEMAEQGENPKASSECFNPDWQVLSAGAVTHPGLPHWRPHWQGIKGAARASRLELNQDLPGARAVFLIPGSLHVQKVVSSQISRELVMNW